MFLIAGKLQSKWRCWPGWCQGCSLAQASQIYQAPRLKIHIQIHSTTWDLRPWIYQHMGVSKNRGTPKSSILIGFSIRNHPFWGPTPIFGNTHVDISISISVTNTIDLSSSLQVICSRCSRHYVFFYGIGHKRGIMDTWITCLNNVYMSSLYCYAMFCICLVPNIQDYIVGSLKFSKPISEFWVL